MINKWIYSF